MSKTEHMSLEQYQEMRNPKKKQTKYRNKPTFVEDQRFDSQKEAARYVKLALLQKMGEIYDLATQPAYTFEIDGEEITYASGRKITYRADFKYRQVKDGPWIVEDVKSPITAQNPAYKLKKALMYWVNKIDILET